MRILSTAAPAMLAMALAACATAPAPPTDPVEVREAALRYMFANNLSGLQRSAGTYCVGLGQQPGLRDPSPQLLAALNDVRPTVRPASACRIEGPRVVDAAGRASLIFNVDVLRCMGDACVVRAGYYEANASAAAGEYTLYRSGGRWRVDPSRTAPGPVA